MFSGDRKNTMVRGKHSVVLAVSIIKEHFGEIVSKVCGCLLERGSLSLQEIRRSTDLSEDQVKICLRVLIHHNCAQAFSVPTQPGAIEKEVTLYMAIFDHVIHRTRFRNSSQLSQMSLDPSVSFFFGGILKHGRRSLEQLIERATSKQGSAIDHDALITSFNQLVQAQYVERCPKPEPFLATSEDEAPKKKRDKTGLETMTLEKQALEAATLADAERFSGIMSASSDSVSEDIFTRNVPGVGDKRKLEAVVVDKQIEASIVENEAFWRANFEKFMYYFKKKACVNYKKANLCLDAGVVLEAMIDSCDVKKRVGNSVSSSLDSIHERLTANPEAHIMDKQHVRAILEELGCESSIEDLTTFYTINLNEIIEDCRVSEVESIVLRRYGKDAYRMFRLLATKHQPFETDKISDVTFVDKKEAQTLLYKLWKDNILVMEKMASQEQRKTYFVWKVNRHARLENILDEMYHAAYNLNERIAYNYEQNKEVADLPVNAMTAIQKQKYSRFANRKRILENSLLKLDDVLMLFHDY